MTQIHCDRKHCLNNDKHGICTAETIELTEDAKHIALANTHLSKRLEYVSDHIEE